MSPLEATLARRHLPALDGIRALAVFTVIGLHLGYSRIPGYLGVLAFFVISGFLITRLLIEEYSNTGAISLRRFYWRRTLRIFPAFYCYWLILMLYDKATAALMEPAAAWSSFFYVSNYYFSFPVRLTPHLTHTWSLAVEEQFYLLWPFVFRWQAHNMDRLWRWLAAVVVCVQIWRAVVVYGFAAERWPTLTFDTRCDALLVGCILAILLKIKPASKSWTALCRSPAYALAPLAVLTLAAYVNWAHRHEGTSIGLAIAPFACAFLLVQCLHFSGKSPWTFLEWPWLRYCGRISYALYLYHLLAIKAALDFIPGAHAIRIFAGLILTLAVASASYFFIEMPFLRLKQRFSSAPRRQSGFSIESPIVQSQNAAASQISAIEQR